MSGAARARVRAARKQPRSLQERINELQARAAAAKKKHDLKETIAIARKELQALNRGKK